MSEKPLVKIPELCREHQSMLVHEAGYAESDPWRALTIATQIALFQAVTCDPRGHAAMGGKIENVSSLGCLACRRPDSFGEIVETAKAHDLGAIKALGERWVNEHRREPA